MLYLFRNAKVLTPFSRQDGVVLVEDGVIVDIVQHAEHSRSAETIDAKGRYLAPGFVDIHVHGGGGAGVADETPEAIIQMANAHAQFGTTTLVPTTHSAPMESLARQIDCIRQASLLACDANIAGAHLEGPFLSPNRAGLHDASCLRAPEEANWAELIASWDGIRVMGAAPELAGAMEFGRALAERGIVASIAHSDADYAQVLRAVSNGFSDVSQPYVHCSGLTLRNGQQIPGVIECALVMDELTVQLCPDGRYVPAALMQLVFACKGAESVSLVTDGAAQSALPLSEGERFQGKDGRTLVFEDGMLRTAADRLYAGSVMTMDRLLRNMIAAGVPTRAALRMATINPARRIGLGESKGRIAPGYDADILLLGEDLTVDFVMTKGRIVKNAL